MIQYSQCIQSTHHGFVTDDDLDKTVLGECLDKIRNIVQRYFFRKTLNFRQDCGTQQGEFIHKQNNAVLTVVEGIEFLEERIKGYRPGITLIRTEQIGNRHIVFVQHLYYIRMTAFDFVFKSGHNCGIECPLEAM